jgi:hypothetical protein
MIKTTIAFAVLLATVTMLCVAGPAAMAQDFPEKQAVLEQLRITTIGDMIVRKSDPRQSTTTLTTSSGSHGFSTSTSNTYDSTPRPAGQILRIKNPTIYDIKNLSIECVYFAESGTPITKLSQTFLKIFRTGLTVEVRMDTPLAPEADYVLCGPRDFEYIGIGIPPKPESEGRTGEPSIANGTAKPVVDEWGVGSGRKVF